MRAARSLLVAALGTAAVTLTACSGGSPSPTVAQLGSAATTTAAPSNAPSQGNDLAKLTAYSACMRSHGMPNFPDPVQGANGSIGLQIKGGPGTGLDPSSAAFQSAQNACKSLLPNGGVTKPMTPAEQQKWLSWASCIRHHGIPDFPDPQFGNGGGVRITTQGGAGKSLGPDDPQMQAAQNACKALMPSLGGKG